MNRNDANNLSLKFKGLMPRMTDEQVKLIRDELLGVQDFATAEKRIVSYCTARADFDLASAVNAIRNRHDFARQTKSRMAEYQDYELAAAEQHAQEDAAIETLSADERDRLIAESLAHLPESIASIERRRPALSRLMKGMMYQRMVERSGQNVRV